MPGAEENTTPVVETPQVETPTQEVPAGNDVDQLIAAQKEIIQKDGKLPEPKDEVNTNNIGIDDPEELKKVLTKTRKEAADYRVKKVELEKELKDYREKEQAELEAQKSLEQKLLERETTLEKTTKTNEEYEDFIKTALAEEKAEVPEQFRNLIPAEYGPLKQLEYIRKAKKANVFKEPEPPMVVNHTKPDVKPTAQHAKGMTSQEKIREGLKKRA